MKMFSNNSGECPMFPPWITGFDWAEVGCDKTANVNLEDKNMDMPRIQPGMVIVTQLGNSGIVYKTNGVGCGGRTMYIATSFDGQEFGADKGSIESVYKKYGGIGTHGGVDIIDCTYRRIWTRPQSQYAQILQPEIDRLDRQLCDGTGYENGRAHGRIEGMKEALKLLESHDKKNREEPPK